MPEAFGISPALQTLDVVNIIVRAGLTEVVWDSQIAPVFWTRFRVGLDVDAAFFAFQSTMGALKHFLYGQNFAPSNQSRFLIFGQIELFINGYDIRQSHPPEIS